MTYFLHFFLTIPGILSRCLSSIWKIVLLTIIMVGRRWVDANSRVGPSVRASLWTISDSLGYLHFTIWARKKTMKTMTKDEQLVMSQAVVSKLK